MEKLEIANRDPKIKSLIQFNMVHGIGPKHAKLLADAGHGAIDTFTPSLYSKQRN